MGERTREERICKLKTMRAELMAIKEEMKIEDDDSESTNTSLDSIRKGYSADLEESKSQEKTIDDAKQEVYLQYDSDKQSHNEEQEGKFTCGLRR